MNQQLNQPSSEATSPAGTQSIVDAQIDDDLIRRALASIPQGLVNIFDHDLRYLFAAGRGWDELGIRPELLRGKTLEELYPQEIVEYVKPYYQQALKGQDVTFDLLLGQRWYTVQAAPIFDAEGSVEAIIAVAQESSDRKQAEAALEKTNHEILSIWESMTDAFFALDAQWCFTYINAQAERILQRKREDLLGKNVWLEFPEAVDDVFYAQYHLAVAQQKAAHFEAFYPALDLWVDVHAYPYSAGLSVYFHDITQRIQGEEVQNRLATIVESSNDAILSTDRDFLITSWNRAATQLFGFSAEEVIGRPLSIVWPTEHSTEAATLLSNVLEGERIQCFETERIHKDGHRLHVSLTISPLPDALGRTIGVFGIVRDIGEFKRAAETQARLAAIVESSGDAISSFDIDGITTSWNRGAEQLYGYTAAEMVGRSVTILSPSDQPNEIPDILSRISRGESIRNFETLRRRKDGSLVDISLTISPLFDAKGRLIGSSAITRDISQRKQAEEALIRSENLYRTLAQHFPNGSVYLLDRDARVLVAEGRGLSTVGLSKENLLGKLPREIFSPPELWQKLEAEHQRAVQGEESTYEIEYQGRSRFIHVVPVPDENGGISSVLAMTQDITERKQAEEALRQSEARLARAQKVAHLGYMELYPGTGEDFWSDETYRILGLVPGSLEPKFQNFAEFVHPEDLELAKRSAQNLFYHHQSFEIEHRIVRRNGEVRWIQAQADILGDGDARTGVNRFVCTLLDITERKQAEEAQVRLAAIVESSDDAILSKTLDGIVTTWNRGAEQMYGYSAQEIIGRHMKMLLPPDRAEEEEKILERLRRGEPLQNLETRRQRKDGGIIDVSISSSPLLNSLGNIIGASSIARDITAQKASQAEQAQLNLELEHQRRRLDDILAHVPGIVWENNIDPQTFQQSVNYVSNYVEQMLGYTQYEWLHSPDLWLSAVHPEDRERILAQSQAVIWEGNGSVLQYRFVARDGRVIWTETHCAVVRDEHGTVVGLRGVTMDITERMRAQEEQSRLAALLEATTDFVGWVDTGGHVQYINPAGRAMLGISPDEAIEGSHLSEFCPQWTYDMLVNIAYPAATRDGSWSGETAFLSRDGREIPVSRVLTAHKDATGNVIYYSTIARDISESKRVQAVLERANEELEVRVAQRTEELKHINDNLRVEIIERQMAVSTLREVVQLLEQAKQDADRARTQAEASQVEAERANLAKSEFLSRMSHELRTPLNSIIGFGQLLRRSPLSDKQQERLGLMVSAGQHLLELINEVLDIARVESGNLHLSIEPVRVSEVVSETLGLVHPLAGRHSIAIENEVAASGPFALADRQRLKQVLLNLLSNAIKYNFEGGSVWVRCEAAPDDQLCISVTNTGRGISPEYLSRLFVPFDRLGQESSQIEGTGLGLALSRRLVEAMNGSLRALSRPDEETSFQISLPLASDPQDALRAAKMEMQPSEHSFKEEHRVLYIEDNLSNLKLIEDIFTDVLPLRLIPAMQGGLGLDLAREHRPRLILLDLHLPDMDGSEVLRRLKSDESTRDIPVVVLSADATQGQIERLLALGAHRYLTKPLDVDQFISVLDELLQKQEIPHARE